jgi:anti-sigma B factor antagonist
MATSGSHMQDAPSTVPRMSEPGPRLEISATANGWEVRGEIDAHTAPTLAAAMAELPAGVVAVDVAGVSFMDSSGLRVLIEAATRARQGGGDLIIVHSTPGIARLVEISGLRGQLRLDD